MPGYPRTSREFKNSKFKICIDQESNWGSHGCLCHQMTYTTRPNSHIQEQQIWKYKLDLTSSCQSYKFPVLKQNSDILYNCFTLVWIFDQIFNTFSNSGNLHQSILRGADQFARIFKSWNSILKKLFNYEYLYIYVMSLLWPYIVQKLKWVRTCI